MIIGHAICATEPEIQPVTGSNCIQSPSYCCILRSCVRALPQPKGMISFRLVFSLQGEMTDPSSVPPYGGGW